MPCINILPLNLRNKIAAGEVVERPASVVKELVENSIDAMASRIEIDILKAGKRLIRVSDNGIGMDRQDAIVAFERYATSKIKDEHDLFNIKTMGFRGEALSSIASVSKVRLITSQKSEIGTCMEIIGGNVKEIKDCSAIGTSIEIRDLFFNTPARRKFLKSDSTENYHIIDTVTCEAISHHHIGFVLTIDNNCVLNLSPSSSHIERILQIFGKDFASELIDIESGDEQIYIKLFLGKITNLRNNKNNQFLFINNRPVKDPSTTYAVYKAYEELIPKGKHPVFFIFITIDPVLVDFNVHPTKREVRFEDKNRVFNLVYRAAKEALKNGSLETQKATTIDYQSDEDIRVESWHPQKVVGLSDVQKKGISAISESASLYSDVMTAAIQSFYIGDTFIAIPEKNGLTIIDYHAAHERINYERLLKKTQGRQHKIEYRLLFPQQIKLQSSEYRTIVENLQLINEIGLEVDDFGHGTILVRGLPEFLKDADLNALMSDIAVSLRSGFRVWSLESPEGLEPVDSIKKMLAQKIACHKSIRGKEVPDNMKISQLLKDLDETENPHTCPHGRPTKIFISIDELRKMFKK
ncbi:DNA mismatch repair protein MutL [hot springs metagenome]|uniref:DNA mismatch repair protein MutL n=1 Tax=hot springs metagenome TaxID=433727 RepID=A0A5J4L3Q7_9ZZZZ